jgi:hypothetical protein
MKILNLPNINLLVAPPIGYPQVHPASTMMNPPSYFAYSNQGYTGSFPAASSAPMQNRKQWPIFVRCVVKSVVIYAVGSV